jgi:prepilin signal peptidase PulO-like enzyme (type II secretory pathway)
MTILYTSLIFIFGSLLTSFYLVLGERLPKNDSINGRSHCDTCHHELRWIDIIPIFGYLINRGKCHFCKSKIPICHLILELLGGASILHILCNLWILIRVSNPFNLYICIHD